MSEEDDRQLKTEESSDAAAAPSAAAAAVKTDGDDNTGGPCPLRPVFLGNLRTGYSTEDVIAIFERPRRSDLYDPVPVDRIDLKRGYCFVFLKDAPNQTTKEKAERYVSDLNGMDVARVSNSLRAEFARGDGKVKRKEDERRKNIEPSDTLFVVNFAEDTTHREDLQMLFEPFGDLVRIDMKRNYAFIQFRTIAQATKAKETTNGGKLDQSVLTVEYVARQRADRDDRGRNDRGGDRRGRGPRYDRDRYSNDRRNDRYDRGGGGRDRYDDRDRGGYRGGGRDRSRSRSPPRYERGGGYRGGGGSGRYDDRYDDRERVSGGYRRSSRSRSRSPPGPRYDRGGGGGGGYRGDGMDRGGTDRDRGPSPGRDGDRGYDRGMDRDRGYRP